MSSGAPRGPWARARRFWQAHPGAPNVLSTAGSFSPPVGSRIGNDPDSGYYIDFQLKADAPEWPPPWLPSAEREIHVASAQFGLGCLERYQAGDGDEWLDTAVAAAAHLLEIQAPDGGWPHGAPMPHTYWLRPPWLSAMAQGEGASLFVRLHAVTGDERYVEAAIAAMRPMEVPATAGGVAAELGGGYFPEEYPTEPGSYVLNGAIFALWGCRDVSIATGDELATRLYAEGIETLAANIDRYDVGFWSRYDLFPHPVRNIASGAYHQLHLTQLRAQQTIDPKPSFAAAIERFAAYQDSATCRSRATAEKVAFRLAVPRTSRLALKTPWAHRPQQGEVLVLCYHALSDAWATSLSIHTDALATQVAMLLDRGYDGDVLRRRRAGARPAPRGDLRRRLPLGARDGLPVLERLGVAGDDLRRRPRISSGARAPLGWPGIDHWADQPRARRSCRWLGRAAQSCRRGLGDRLAHVLAPAADDARRRRARGGAHASRGRRRRAAWDRPAIDRLSLRRRRRAGRRGHARRGLRRRAQGYRAGWEPPRRLLWPRVGIYRADSELTFLAKVSRGVRRLRRMRSWDAVYGFVAGRRAAG